MSEFDSDRTQEIAKALREEFREAEETKSPRKTTIKDIEDLKDDALTRIRNVIKHSDSDTLATKVSMWAIDHLITSTNKEGDPMQEFFREMAAASPPTETTPSKDG